MESTSSNSGNWWRTSSPQIVGSIGTPNDLASYNSDLVAVDLVEMRIDLLLGAGMTREEIDEQWPQCEVLLTVRDPSEGGAGHLSMEQREELYDAFIERAVAVDIELRKCHELPSAIARAKEIGLCIVGSAHSFDCVVDEPWLEETAGYANEQIDVVKVASKVETLTDIDRLVKWGQKLDRPFSVMGMGPLGPVSRVIAAQAGSMLNYGYISEPTAPGQWSAELLAKAVACSTPLYSK